MAVTRQPCLQVWLALALLVSCLPGFKWNAASFRPGDRCGEFHWGICKLGQASHQVEVQRLTGNESVLECLPCAQLGRPRVSASAPTPGAGAQRSPRKGVRAGAPSWERGDGAGGGEARQQLPREAGEKANRCPGGLVTQAGRQAACERSLGPGAGPVLSSWRTGHYL